MNLNLFGRNPEVGKSPRQIDEEISEVAAETLKRQGNHLDVEDQQARMANLRAARGTAN